MRYDWRLQRQVLTAFLALALYGALAAIAVIFVQPIVRLSNAVDKISEYLDEIATLVRSGPRP